MTTEKILNTITQAAVYMLEDDKKGYDFALEHADIKSDKAFNTGMILGALVRELQTDLIKAEAKTGGRQVQYKALERIIKNVPDYKRETMGGTMTTGSGLRAVCDGCRAVRIKNSGVVMPPAVDAPDLMQIDNLFQNSGVLYDCELPTVSKLKALIKVAKAERTGNRRAKFVPVYRVTGSNGLDIYLDGQYLVDMMEALPGAVCKCAIGPYAPVFFEGADGDGLLCPIKYNYGDPTHPLLNDIESRTATA